MAAGLDLIVITDHNSSENVSAVRAACEPDVHVLGGMEITSSEDIHIIAICPDRDALAELQNEVYRHLPGTNDPDLFGEQYIVDEEGFIVDSNNHLLAGATDLEIEALILLVRKHNGLVIASHVDRMSYSVTSQLGFIPPGFDIDAVELSALAGREHFSDEAYRYPRVMGSDAHEPDQIGSAWISISNESTASVSPSRGSPSRGSSGSRAPMRGSPTFSDVAFALESGGTRTGRTGDPRNGGPRNGEPSTNESATRASATRASVIRK